MKIFKYILEDQHKTTIISSSFFLAHHHGKYEWIRTTNEIECEIENWRPSFKQRTFEVIKPRRSEKPPRSVSCFFVSLFFFCYNRGVLFFSHESAYGVMCGASVGISVNKLQLPEQTKTAKGIKMKERMKEITSFILFF